MSSLHCHCLGSCNVNLTFYTWGQVQVTSVEFLSSNNMLLSPSTTTTSPLPAHAAQSDGSVEIPAYTGPSTRISSDPYTLQDNTTHTTLTQHHLNDTNTIHIYDMTLPGDVILTWLDGCWLFSRTRTQYVLAGWMALLPTA